LAQLGGSRWREALPFYAANTLFDACAWLVRDAFVPRAMFIDEKRQNAIRIQVTFSWRFGVVLP
jgi:hypothetical protein